MRGLTGTVLVIALVVIGCGAVDRSVDSGGPDVPAVPTPVPGGPDISGPPAAAGPVGPTPAINPDRVGAAVPIGAGSAATGGWGAWAYRLKDGSMCLEFVGGDSGGAACGPEVSMLKPTTSTSERDGFVSGGTTEATAVGAVIRFADGTATKAPLIVPGDISTIGGRYYVAAIPPTVQTVTVDIVDAGGAVLETATLNVR